MKLIFNIVCFEYNSCKVLNLNISFKNSPSLRSQFVWSHLRLVPHFTDTQSLARDTPYCARSTLDIVVQAR